jgi:probable rRNA maturation factor
MIIIEPPQSPTKGRHPFNKRELQQFLALAKKAVPVRGAVTVLVTSDAAIRELNRRFRHKDKATDVLSFPAEDFSHSGAKNGDIRAPRIAGDLAVSIETASRQAEAFGHALTVELNILVLHGLLHLAGLDHETDAGEMAARERELRNEFGLPAGLIQRSEPSRTSRRVQKTTATPVSTAKPSSTTQSRPKRQAHAL